MIAMALDVGDKRIGIATNDPVLLLAHPAAPLFRCGNAAKDAEEIARRASEAGAERIVCGLPVHADGKESDQTAKTRAFADLLREKTGLPVFYEDERYTTLEAGRLLAESGVRRDKRKRAIDSIAAALILETYLEKIKRQGEPQ